MKISKVVNSGKISLSFEVFPPKTEDTFDSVETAIEEIAKLSPSFLSVTYGAGGGISENTLKIATIIKEKYSVPTLAHLTCVSSSKEFVRKRIQDFRRAGIENIMALRGDIPDELKNQDRSGWEYKHAVELIRDIKQIDENFCIGCACYPEVHPESANQKEDLKYIKEKVDAGADFLTTQMFFDNNLLYNFLYKLRETGVRVPVVAGIMPIINASQVKRAIQLSGSFMPQRFKALVDKFGYDKDAMKQAGIAYATDQIIDLFANGINNVHVYTMNKPDVAKTIQQNLSFMIGK